MTPNPDSRAQGHSGGSSAMTSPNSVAEAPARSAFDDMTRLANIAMYKVERYRGELLMVRESFLQIERELDRMHIVSVLARGHRHQIERLLAELEGT